MKLSHNLKAAGSNPAPATNKINHLSCNRKSGKIAGAGLVPNFQAGGVIVFDILCGLSTILIDMAIPDICKLLEETAF